MLGILPFACVPNPVWTPVASEIHSAIWDLVGLEIVQGRVREWATTWNDKAKAFAIEQEKHNEIRKNDADWCSDWYPVFPAIPLPPSNESISIAEKWASLAAIQDVFGFTGDKVLPWPLPENDRDLVAYTEWLKGDAGAYQLLLRRAGELPESYAETVRHWLEYVKKHTHIAKAGGTPEDGRHGAGTTSIDSKRPTEQIAPVVDGPRYSIATAADAEDAPKQDKWEQLKAFAQRHFRDKTAIQANVICIADGTRRYQDFLTKVYAESNPTGQSRRWYAFLQQVNKKLERESFGYSLKRSYNDIELVDSTEIPKAKKHKTSTKHKGKSSKRLARK